MYNEISFNEFVDAFRDMNRENNFSYDGLKALFDYLEEYEESTGTQLKLDVIALCVEYTEYKNVRDFLDSYFPNEITNFEEWQKEGNKGNKEDYYNDIENELEEYLENNTILIKIGESLNDGFIVQEF